MRIVVGTVDGAVHASAPFSEQDIQDYIDETSGRVGWGTQKDMVVHTVEEVIELMSEAFRYDKEAGFQTASIQMLNGTERQFNVQHVVWWEVQK